MKIYLMKGGDEMSELSKQMVIYRAKKRITQTELAALCGLSTQTINSVETDQQKPSRVTEAKIRLVIEEEREG